MLLFEQCMILEGQGGNKMEVKIDSEAVNAAVAAAIIDSALGEQVQLAVTEFFKKYGYPERSPVGDAVKDQMAKEVRKIVESEYKTQINDFVRKQMSEDDVLQKIWEPAMSKFISSIGREY